ncbi:MAG: 50S ribosomal protein L24 [Bacteroidia bacterium]|nr:50S ribosomal protein L24 [Bacteroidia bacterium]
MIKNTLYPKHKKLHVKTGDLVKVLSGDYKGVEARIVRMYPTKQTAIVEGVNIIKKRMKPDQQNPNGRVLEMESPIRVCKLQLIDPKTGKSTRIGRVRNPNGRGLIRVSKKTKQPI